MASSTEDHYPIPSLNACLPRKAIMCFEKSMKEYVGLTKPKTPSVGKLLQGYYWPNMSKDAFQLVQRCTKCQQFARFTHQPSNI